MIWRPLNVLVGGERFGVVRDAFIALGHNAVSCDLAPTEAPGPHYQGYWEEIEGTPGIDLAIFHRTCTYMANSGAKHLYVDGRKENGPDMQRWVDMIGHAWDFWNHRDTCPIPFVAWENPIMLSYAETIVGKHTQAVQPWWFGTDEDGPDNVTKETWWWLKNLPKLKRTGTLDGSTARPEVHLKGPTKNPEERRMARSKFTPGHAAALADQWSRAVLEATS